MLTRTKTSFSRINRSKQLLLIRLVLSLRLPTTTYSTSPSSSLPRLTNQNIHYPSWVNNVNSRVMTTQQLQQKALEEGTSRDAKERVFTVDKHNQPTEAGHLRHEMRLHNLWHRATYVVIRHVSNDGDDDDKDAPVLVQQRSMIKDYCPGKLDPTPGGVVEFGESYEENAQRELQEEMGIVVPSPQEGDTKEEEEIKEEQTNIATMKQLFVFPYTDEHVRCWGGLFEVIYKGSIEDLVLQTEEVDQVYSMSLQDIQQRMTRSPDEWMPDARHAMKLYLQYLHDRKVRRRFLKGYSSGDVDRYGVRPKPKVVFFDCDDCLYFDGWKVAKMLTKKIDEWCVTQHGLAHGEAYVLYKEYGTALRGLLAKGLISTDRVDEFLAFVHDIPIGSHIAPDPKLRELISGIDPSIQKFIFTASVRHHAERCLRALGIDDLFPIDNIIDVKACALETKHSVSSFQAAMRIAQVENPEECVFLDDSRTNIQAARKIGWRSILVGRIARDTGAAISSDHAENEIDHIHDFPKVLPELFRAGEVA